MPYLTIWTQYENSSNLYVSGKGDVRTKDSCFLGLSICHLEVIYKKKPAKGGGWGGG
jgi:hypothetical protein